MTGKQLTILLFVFLFVFIGCSDNTNISYPLKDKILFIGDSNTYSYKWNKRFGRNDIVNLGEYGNRTHGVLEKLDSYLSQKPKSIFIMIGINDINTNLSMKVIKNNYSKIIDKILSNNTSLYIQSTLYMNENLRINFEKSNRRDKNLVHINVEKGNRRVKILNNYLVEQCKLKSIKYIDVNRKLSDNNILSPKYLQKDGVHLNGYGCFLWSQILLPYINKLQ